MVLKWFDDLKQDTVGTDDAEFDYPNSAVVPENKKSSQNSFVIKLTS